MADNGVHPTEEDPAAAFLAQQESEIAGIENDGEGFGSLEAAEDEQPPQPEPEPEPAANYDGFEDEPATVNGDMFEESNGPTDSYAAIAQVDIQRQEPESLRKWREEQKTRLEALDLASKTAEAEWKEKAKKELEDWHVHQSEQMEKNKANNRLCPSLARYHSASVALAFANFLSPVSVKALTKESSEEILVQGCVSSKQNRKLKGMQTAKRKCHIFLLR
ncbi:clathrin light chain B isoform X2 [Notothenia coriiceps]|uniref:Clathrin light chain n=1 Tax=Notothenia coriiceps TaxID=8208 RepID=A0A6I9PCL6_9TELE|nr:PREDICTED: clathrin light chain B isoform X2 [Notothenia coriiceps]